MPDTLSVNRLDLSQDHANEPDIIVTRRQFNVFVVEDTEMMPAGIYFRDLDAERWRLPTDDEISTLLRTKRPHLFEYVEARTLRRVMSDADGELLALFRERRQLSFRPRPSQKRLAENLAAICETPASTDVGVYLKASLLMEDCSKWPAVRLTNVQRQQLTWAVMAWTLATGDGAPLTVRPVDRPKIAEHLRQYAKPQRPIRIASSKRARKSKRH